MKDSVPTLINQYPAPILRQRAYTVNPITPSLTKTLDTQWEPNIIECVTDLKVAAQHLVTNCLGLAANQIWTTSDTYPAIFVMRWPSADYKNWEWQEVINPKIQLSGKRRKLPEGCLSLITEKVGSNKKERRSNVLLTYQTLDNTVLQTIKFYGHLGPYAQTVQHEYDHLMGKLCIE